MFVSLSIDAVAGEWIAAGEALVRVLGQDNITLYWVCVECLGWDAGAVEMVSSGWGVAWTSAQGIWTTGAWAIQSECFSVCIAEVMTGHIPGAGECQTG